MIITSIEEPKNGVWHGTAKLGTRNLQWSYRSGDLKLREQDTGNPIDPPPRVFEQIQAVVRKAIRRLDVGDAS